jgi:hypothetical protein
MMPSVSDYPGKQHSRPHGIRHGIGSDFYEYANQELSLKVAAYDAETHVLRAICAFLGRILVGVKSGLVLLPRYFPA